MDDCVLPSQAVNSNRYNILIEISEQQNLFSQFEGRMTDERWKANCSDRLLFILLLCRNGLELGGLIGKRFMQKLC